MVTNVFLRLDGVTGECQQRGHERWIELQGWDWEVEAATSWTKGGGASVGKPKPGALTWSHLFDLSSIGLLGRIASGTAFASADLDVAKTTGKAVPETYLSLALQGVYVTKVTMSATEDGAVVQRVSMVFKRVTADYRPQDRKTGALGAPAEFSWDIPAGTASPSS
jgi:type VI secretion system Hcp family effector